MATAALAYGLQQLEHQLLAHQADKTERETLRRAFMAGAWLCNQVHLQAARADSKTTAAELLTGLQFELLTFGAEADAMAGVAGGAA